MPERVHGNGIYTYPLRPPVPSDPDNPDSWGGTEAIDYVRFKQYRIKFDDMNFNLRLDLSLDKKNNPAGSFDMRYLDSRFEGDYVYQDSEVQLLPSNFSNSYVKGIIEGKIAIKPFLYFNLQAEADKLNFKNIFKDIENLDLNEQTQIFVPNKNIFKYIA